MKALLLLADGAHAVGGKLYVLGGGWNIMAGHAPCAVAAKLEIPWADATRPHTLRLEIVDADGNPMTAQNEDGDEQPFWLEHTFSTGIPAGAPEGVPVPYVFALNVGPLPYEPNTQYEWKLTIDGHFDPSWTVGFTTIPPLQSHQQAA